MGQTNQSISHSPTALASAIHLASNPNLSYCVFPCLLNNISTLLMGCPLLKSMGNSFSYARFPGHVCNQQDWDVVRVRGKEVYNLTPKEQISTSPICTGSINSFLNKCVARPPIIPYEHVPLITHINQSKVEKSILKR